MRAFPRFIAIAATIPILAFGAPARPASAAPNPSVILPNFYGVEYVNGHPVDALGFVTDGSAQLDDAHCVGDPRSVAECLVARRFLWWWPEYLCLAGIVNHEDPEWDPTRWNGRGSGAYGLPQALPGSKMASAGPDWATSARTQLVWLLDRYSPVYGGICGAWRHEEWYGTY